MNWENLTQEDFLQLNAKELKSYLKKAASVANARLQYAKKVKQKTGLDYSPAVRAWEESGKGRFGGVRGKNLNQLREEFVRTKNFLDQKTSKVSEWRDLIAETSKELESYGLKIKDEDQFSNMFKAFEKLKKMDSTVAEKQFKYTVLESVRAEVEANPEKSLDTIASDVYKKLDEIYEKNKQINNKFDNSRLFTLAEESE